MITVKRDNDSVAISISTSLANDCKGLEMATIPFKWTTGMVYTADLLKRYISKLIWDAIAATRKDYYNLGWSDAKSKKIKQEDFSGNL
jgi:hypothetical protein